MKARTHNQVSKAVPKAPSPAQAQAPEKIDDLESPVCDVTNMAGILCDMIEALVTQAPPVSTETHVFCNAEDRDKLAYAAHEVSDQLLALKSRFYGIYHAELEQRRDKKGGEA